MQKWETHMHTFRGSACGLVRAKKAAEVYKKAGYDGVVLTNHFNMANFRSYYGGRQKNWIKRYLKEFFSFRKYCEKQGVKALLGLELSLIPDEKSIRSKTYAELLLYGITPEELALYGLDLLRLSQADLFYLCEKNGWILGQSHPFRDHVKLLDTDYMHFVEAYNGHPGHNSRNDQANALAEEKGLSKSGGSDFHRLGYEKCGMAFPDSVTIENEKDFAAALKSGIGTIIKREN